MTTASGFRAALEPWVPILTIALPVLGGLIGAWLTQRVAKHKTDTDADAARRKGDFDAALEVRGGFQLLVKDLREQVTILTQINRDQTVEIKALHGEVRRLSRQLARLEHIINERGIDLGDDDPNGNGGPPLDS